MAGSRLERAHSYACHHLLMYSRFTKFVVREAYLTPPPSGLELHVVYPPINFATSCLRRSIKPKFMDIFRPTVRHHYRRLGTSTDVLGIIFPLNNILQSIPYKIMLIMYNRTPSTNRKTFYRPHWTFDIYFLAGSFQSACRQRFPGLMAPLHNCCVITVTLSWNMP